MADEIKENYFYLCYVDSRLCEADVKMTSEDLDRLESVDISRSDPDRLQYWIQTASTGTSLQNLEHMA